MDIKSSIQGNVTVLEVSGDFSGRAAGGLKQEIQSLKDREISRLVIVMAGLTYIDSSGVSILIAAHNDLQAAGGGLKLVNLSEPVQTVFESTRLTSFFQIWDSVEQALMVFGEKPSV